MKKLFIGLFALALGTGAAEAQDAPQQPKQQMHRDDQHPGMRHGMRDGMRGGHGREGMMGHNIHFSDQQKQQLKDINTKYRQQLTDLKKNEDITVREYKAKMAAIHKDHRDQMQALLTPEQKAQIQKDKDQRKEMAKVNAKAREEKMKIKLGLSDDQAKKLSDMRAGTFSKMKQIREDKSLTPEQKKEQVQSLVKGQRDQMKSVLTPEQLKQLNEMHGGGGHRPHGEWSK